MTDKAGVEVGGLAAMGLGAAKCTPRNGDPTIFDVAFSGPDADCSTRARLLALRSLTGAVTFPGTYTLIDENAAEQQPVTLVVEQTGGVSFTIAAQWGNDQHGRGLALTDPDDGRSLLVSWWTGDADPYGVVKYAIRDARTIAGYYVSKMTPDRPGRDIAIGDTSDGLPGRYLLMSEEESGRTWGPHDWRVARRGDIVDLSWTEHGKVFCRGLGIIDPADDRAFIATYIPV